MLNLFVLKINFSFLCYYYFQKKKGCLSDYVSVGNNKQNQTWLE